MWRCRFRANEGRDLVRERIRADVMDFVALPTTVTGARYDCGQRDAAEPGLCGPHSDNYRPISNAFAPKYPLRNFAGSSSPSSHPRSEYARSYTPSSEYARGGSIYDDADLQDDEIAQKLKELRPRKTYTVHSDDELEDDSQDKVSPFSKMHYSNAPSLVLQQSQRRAAPSVDQYAKMLEKYGNTVGRTSLL